MIYRCRYIYSPALAPLDSKERDREQEQRDVLDPAVAVSSCK